MLAYGPKMPAILRDVEATRWTKKPLGPLGRYVKVRDQQWSGVVESFGSRIFNAFVVSNDQDRVKIGTIYSIIELKYDDRFDCSGGEPDGDLLTVLRAVKISNRHVEQAFIKATGCEDAVLVEKRYQRDRLFDARRRNVRVVYTQDMFIVSRRQEEADEALASIHRLGKAADIRRQESRRSLTQLRRLVESDRQKLHEKAPSNIAAIEDLRDESQAELDSTLAQYEEALKRHNSECGVGHVASFVKKKEEINLAIKEADDLLSRLMVSRNCSSISAAGALQHSESNLLFRSQRKVNTAIAERTEAEKVIIQHQKKLDEVQVEVNGMREQVDEMQQRATQLDHDIKTLKAAIRARERDLGATLDELNEEVGRRNQVVQRARSILSSLEHFVELLESARRVRTEKWKEWLTSLPASLELHFLRYLATRDFTGRLKFNHRDEELSLYIVTDQDGSKIKGKNNNRWKDVKSWSVAACHIRCLDEFDVFMDAVNRRVAMKMMVDTAKSLKRAQFILITPQGVSNSTYGAEVKIIMLSDPARTQGRLAARVG
ncbi:BQ2448_3619 [Microbotryum intermedium]|uniref:BQ2448_3619 protein n=1 Tax=Microbotryum intermedium TaxID=269621 RepID=A0A238FCF2_9BASI|nr:BQ2448_3619 [Microbotryum intermedium]